MQINNVCEYLISTAEKFPNKIAISDGNSSMTFGELINRIRAVSAHINQITGGVKNKPISIYMGKSIEMIVAYLGVAYSGNFYSPIDKTLPVARIQKIVDLLEPAVVICDQDVPREIVTPAIQTMYYDAVNNLNVEDYMGFENVLDVDPLYVLFTSGSTGFPKGVVVSHRSVIDYAEWLQKTFKFDEKTILGNQAPFYFDNSVLDIYSMVKNGSTMVIIPEMLFSFPSKLLDFLNENHINTIFWVPAALIGVANSRVLEIKKEIQLEKVLFAGEIMPNKQLNIWRRNIPDALYANLYGPTEATDICVYYIVNREFSDDDPLPIGIQCNNMEALILDENNNQILGGEKTGELCIRGIGLAKGYYGNRDDTEKSFVQNPFNDKYTDIIYRTGDLAKYNEHGEILFLGRKDYQIKHQGHRIELGEIETAGFAISNIQSCCALYDEINKKIVFFVELKSDMSEKEIYRELKSKLPKYMLPGIINIIEKMPKNANGKIDRVLLKNKIGEKNAL